MHKNYFRVLIGESTNNSLEQMNIRPISAGLCKGHLWIEDFGVQNRNLDSYSASN